MAAVTTTYLIELAAELASWTDVPADCVVEEPGTRLSSLLAVLAAGPAEVFLARQLGYHAVIGATTPLRTAAGAAVIEREAAALRAAGVPDAAADEVIQARVRALRLAALGEESERAAEVARLVEQPLVSIGPAVAELARRVLQERVDAALAAESDAPVAALGMAVETLPAFADTLPLVVFGSMDAPVGRALVVADLPTPGAEGVVRAYLEAGIATLCVPWLAAESVERLRDWGLPGTVLVLGRAATLRVGLAPYLARLRSEGIEVRSLAGGEG